MIQDLQAERVQVGEAIAVLERIAVGRGRRRGRPPAWMNCGEEAWTTTRKQEQGEARRELENCPQSPSDFALVFICGGRGCSGSVGWRYCLLSLDSEAALSLAYPSSAIFRRAGCLQFGR